MKTKSKDNNRLPSNPTPAPKRQDKGADDRDAGAGEEDQKTSQEIGRVLEVYFKPPLAIARVGGSDTPLESFSWAEDETIHGERRTTLRPAVTLEVAPDGTVRPYFPGAIHFKDGGCLRPVAPFFELWVRFQEKGKSVIKDQPLTLDTLEELKVPLESVVYRITVANRKAQRRTRRAADAFIARVEAAGNDHARKPLLAFSPHNPQEEPLVFAHRPVPLGHFQVIRPAVGRALAVDLSVLRVRFTPAHGEVYGPPTAVHWAGIAAQAGRRAPSVHARRPDPRDRAGGKPNTESEVAVVRLRNGSTGPDGSDAFRQLRRHQRRPEPLVGRRRRHVRRDHRGDDRRCGRAIRREEPGPVELSGLRAGSPAVPIVRRQSR